MRWTVRTLFVSTMLAARHGAAQDGSHVRSLDPVIGGLIARGIERSPTFRELVGR